METLPPMKLMLRSPGEIMIGVLAKDGKTLEIESTTPDKLKKVCVAQNHDMLKLAQDGTLVVQLAEGGKTLSVPVLATQCDFSPSGRYFSVWSKPDVLALYRTETAEEVFQVKTKTLTFNFPLAEEFVALQVGEEVKCWDLTSKEVCFKLKLDRLVSFSLCSTTPELCFATFQLGSKSGPAIISLYSRDKLVCSSQTFRAEECQFKWSPFMPGDVLGKIETTVDPTGKSYYGESRLIRLSLSNVNAVMLPSNPVHDFQWSPRRHSFACVTSSCQIYDAKTCDVMFDFPVTHKNVCCYSPLGRFICFAGFGNLAGQMEFYETKRYKLLGKGRAEAAVNYSWSPCGRMFVTSTLMPRMNVDNGVMVFNYRGEKLARWLAHGQHMIGSTGLVECRFLPTPPLAFPDLPPTPKIEPATGAPMVPEIKKPVMSFTQARLEAKKAQNAPPPAPPPAAPKPPVVVVVEEQDDPSIDPAKMVHKLQKLLKQIEAIELAGPKTPEQVIKMGKKPDTLQQLEKWQAKVKY
ncbi:hypothetical protein BASA81_012637 [Batrachochytrium salamandrivorans]|nr:hypothetical protein BASA81_012637 [Batrachochytrium salamandrivorans]